MLPLQDFLDKAILIYRNRYNKAVDERDAVYAELVSALGGEDEFLQFRQRYYNKQLAAVVTNEKEIPNYSVHDGEMVPIKDAIFRDPAGKPGGHIFMHPVKMFFQTKVDTFWFNLAVIWIFSGLLFVLLYYDVIRRVLTYIETLRLNRLNRLRLNRLLKITEQNRPIMTGRK